MAGLPSTDMTLSEIMERARQAQQEHEQKHDVQLEVPDWNFNERRQAQIEDETGRDPRD